MIKSFYLLFFHLLILFFYMGCDSSNLYEPPQNARFQLLTEGQTHVDFINQVNDSDSFNVFKYRNFYNGAGVALLDVNNDGWIDIYFCSNQGANRLYLNKGGFEFEDITNRAGVEGNSVWTTGVSCADVNGDGWMDIYICNSGYRSPDERKNELFINQKDGTFKETASDFGLADEGLSTHAAFFDYDQDGDLDCYVLNNSLESVINFDYGTSERLNYDSKGGDKFYRNEGNHFVDITKDAGIYGSSFGFGLGVSVSDFNADGYGDIYVSNDFFERDYLYINQKDGTFKDGILDAMGHISMASMGADAADINNDGWVDLFTTEMLPEDDYRQKLTIKFDDYDIVQLKAAKELHNQYIQNALQLNNGDGTFSEISAYAGVMATDWSWSSLLFDFDNDGWKDIYVSNGIFKDMNNQDFVKFFSSHEIFKRILEMKRFDYKEFNNSLQSAKLKNYAFINQRGFRFNNQVNKLGLGYQSFSSGSAYADLDNDGDLDLVVNNVNQPAFVFKNRTRELHATKSHYIKIRLHDYQSANKLGVGTKVTVYTDHLQQFFEVYHSRGFQSSVPAELVVGLYESEQIDSLVVDWPGDCISTYTSLKADTTYVLIKQCMQKKYQEGKQDNLPTWFRSINQSLSPSEIAFKEDFYVDFDVEKLMLQMLSQEGPNSCVGDLNADGRDDIVITGPSGESTKILIQDSKGNLILNTNQLTFDQDKQLEGVACIIDDFDADGRNDILIVHGGNRYNIYDIKPKPVLYVQNKFMQFVKKKKAFSDSVRLNGSAIASFDIDKDGDKDVILGSRSKPGFYGVTPKSFVLRNNGKGTFKDVTFEIAPHIERIGMITQIRLGDMDGDRIDEVVVVGDWFPISIFKVVDGQFNLWKVLPFSGLISQILIDDTDGDGDNDIIVGNHGLNSKLRASDKKPVEMWLNDFDNNGQPECFISYYKSDDQLYPMHQHDDLLSQLPILKKKFLKYESYAGTVSDSIFDDKLVENSTIKKINNLSTGIFWNDGIGNLFYEQLPPRTQFSPIKALTAGDFNKDGYRDILMHGNMYGVKPELGRYDALYGLAASYISGQWVTFLPKQTGFFIKGEVKSIEPIKLGQREVLFVIGNGKAYLFEQQ